MTKQEENIKEANISSRNTESVEEGQLENVTGGVFAQVIIGDATVLGKRTASEVELTNYHRIGDATVLGKRTASEAGLTNYHSGTRKVRIESE